MTLQPPFALFVIFEDIDVESMYVRCDFSFLLYSTIIHHSHLKSIHSHYLSNFIILSLLTSIQ
jgi:hypothetical protein